MREGETEETADGTSGTAQKDKEKEEITGKVRGEDRRDGTTEARGPGGISADTIHSYHPARGDRKRRRDDEDEDERGYVDPENLSMKTLLSMRANALFKKAKQHEEAQVTLEQLGSTLEQLGQHVTTPPSSPPVTPPGTGCGSPMRGSPPPGTPPPSPRADTMGDEVAEGKEAERTDNETSNVGAKTESDNAKEGAKTEETDIEEQRVMNEKDWTMGPEWEKAEVRKLGPRLRGYVLDEV